ncbi:DUF2339 domain-containing protein [Paenibacillus sp. PAMC21692]|uniref:DUF2339 domain-containing protein n=1 Tax=Paenibacillus sp. PAMC21692 TaxID=2762320 RepID=UPI00164D7130|nr:DUF2339 domain-containing protein [Paenibacillus sp. PAMC21692]QNK54470.1 DUF2339 domain-containing protein [Paenibacillus sp. PAMC21692]
MKDTIKNHWTSLLGALFVITAFITMFQFSIDKGWITNAMKIGIGIAAGIAFALAGGRIAQKPKWELTGQILLGIGACILYATFSFAGIYYDMWEPTLVLLGMTAVTAGMLAYAHKFNSRMLTNIALAGGLLAPMLLRPDWDSVLTLFLYLLVLNIAIFYLSITKGWMELRIIAFGGTWLLYTIYFIHFSPATEGLWNMPIRYAICAYLFYTFALLAATWTSKLSFDSVDLYLNAINGLLFGVWALFIWQGDVPYGYVIAGMGVIYAAAGFVLFRLSRFWSVPAVSFVLAGALLLLMSLNNLGEGTLFNVMMWTGFVALLTGVGHIKRWFPAVLIAAIVWFYLGAYWYVVTWTTPRGEWFGVYIPFLNWGAMAWIALAALGFYYSRQLRLPGAGELMNKATSRLFALLAHLIVGGLMTRQIENIFTEYFQSGYGVYMDLTLSVVWGIYALLLILWGNYYKERTFRWFGSIVLVLVAFKAIFVDLSGQEPLYKAIALLALGAISFAITWINSKWRGGEAEKRAREEGPNEEPVSGDTIFVADYAVQNIQGDRKTEAGGGNAGSPSDERD